MKALRASLRDNQIATTFVAFICAFLMLQGMLSGFTRSAMAGSEYENVFGVICSTAGAVHLQANEDDHKTPSKSSDCPCVSLCRLASSALQVALTPTHASFQEPIRSTSLVRYSVISAASSPQSSFYSEARAPPPIS
ncbi:DUF2946 family protein [Brucella sp. NM4]|uniref:DUF2946 family protein n=1 Tax=Brucella/Ochrobactrum group TaxID=2826938 RepID=UPI0024BD2939|nr:DUF2946 family protein [Brucella sp. NM4]WHS30451.1 DUF2946 family protein [Brucella sp. NM4]WHT45203.1 DUF2946 family protein [Ochrobactrum sp. SSR]